MLRAEGRGSGLAGSGVEHSVESFPGDSGHRGVDRPDAMPIHDNRGVNEDVFYQVVKMRMRNKIGGQGLASG